MWSITTHLNILSYFFSVGNKVLVFFKHLINSNVFPVQLIPRPGAMLSGFKAPSSTVSLMK